MTYREEDEMGEEEIRLRFGAIITEAAQAFALDANYAADIIQKAKATLARQAKKLDASI